MFKGRQIWGVTGCLIACFYANPLRTFAEHEHAEAPVATKHEAAPRTAPAEAERESTPNEASAQQPLDGHPALVTRRNVDQTLSLLREASLALLKEGNQRFATGHSKHPNLDSERRSIVVSEGQKPFATILACSDSRSPVEEIFDRGVGDLFVVRVAGNVADDSQLATIEYGVDHLGTPLLVVLGHTGCGAVTAACQGGELPGHLKALVDRIKPAVTKARASAPDPDRFIPVAIQANIWQQMETIFKESDIVREKVKSGSLQVVGGLYDLERGTISWLGAHPSQDNVIAQAEAAEKSRSLARAARAAEAAAASTEEEELARAPFVGSGARSESRGGTATSSATGSGKSTPPPSFYLPSYEVKARGPQPKRETPATEEHEGHH